MLNGSLRLTISDVKYEHLPCVQRDLESLHGPSFVRGVGGCARGCRRQKLTSVLCKGASMDYLKRSAASDYLNLSRVALQLGQVSPHQFLGRLACLKAMCQPGSPEYHYASTILLAEGWEDEDGWPDLPEDQCVDWSDGRQATGERDYMSGGGEDSDQPPYIHFAMSVGGRRWDFIVGDPDHWPSIPHGHGWQDPRWKIDPYRGETFFQTRPKRRIHRRELVAFWNDDKFRGYALGEIDHWAQSHPNWSWRIPQFRRLPRPWR